MMNLSDWKSLDITEVFFNELRRRVHELTQEIAHSAGMDSGNDRYRTGYLQAMEDILNVEMAELEEESHS